MCLKDLLRKLRADGLVVREPQVRWAITSGKISRPPLDGSLRFDFTQEHIEQLRQIFEVKAQEAAQC